MMTRLGTRSDLEHLVHLIRLPNQSGTILLLLPSLWALVLASNGTPDPWLVLVFCLGAFLMRSAGVIFNDLADRRIDRHVARTKQRPLACGALSSGQAVMVLSGILLLAGGLLVFLSPLAIALSPAALGLAALYPFSKRFFPIPQVVLGLAFGWGAIMAWATVRNALDLPVWFLYAATICWAVAYDTIYALQDREDDLRLGVKSAAVFFGAWAWLGIAFSSVLMVLFLGMSGWVANLNGFFYAVLAGVACFLLYQAWQLRHPIAPPRAFDMFKAHTWVGAMVLVGFWLGTWL